MHTTTNLGHWPGPRETHVAINYIRRITRVMTRAMLNKSARMRYQTANLRQTQTIDCPTRHRFSVVAVAIDEAFLVVAAIVRLVV